MNRFHWPRTVILLLLATIMLMLMAPTYPASNDPDYQIQQIIQQRGFDFVTWEIQSLLTKASAALSGNQHYLDEATRSEIVLSYMALVREAQQLDAELNRLYSDPDVEDPDALSAEIQAQLADVRTDIDEIQLLAESILQDQVSTILAEEGLGFAGRAFPPVLMHVTPLPSVLVTSPRDQIVKEHQISLQHGLTTPEREDLESAVVDSLDLAALIVNIGGAGTYPAMITETSNINWLAEVTAHEWSHHWLSLRPLGVMYAFDPEARIINETVASIVDQELGNKVIARYYPEYVVDDSAELPAPTAPDPDAPPPFDFRAEMAITRIRADELLTEGKVQEAEAYMEERRQLFVENGYTLRKLNQAYFAFYGAYAAEPGGAQGSNPIGPMVREIRDNTPSVKAFLDTMAPITSVDDLVAVHANVVGN